MSVVAGLRIEIDTKGVPKATRDVQSFGGASEGMASSVDKAGAALAVMRGPVSAIAKGAAAALGVLAAGIAGVTAASLEQEGVTSRLQGALERSGRSWAESRAEIEAYAAAQQAATTTGDEATLASLARLVDLTAGIGASTEQLLGWQRLATDVAAATGKSLEEATTAVAKAAAGNVEAIGELIPGLRTAAQEAARVGDASDRAAFALAALDDTFGGAARSANGVQIALARIANGAGDAAQALGHIITTNQVVADSLNDVADTTDLVARSFDETTAAGRLMREAIETAASAGARALESLARRAISAANALAEVYAIATGDEADAITDRMDAASDAVATLDGYLHSIDPNTPTSEITTDADDLRRALYAAADANLVMRDAVDEVSAGLDRSGRGYQQAIDQARAMRAGIQEMVEGENGLRAQLGATNQAFADRAAALDDLLADEPGQAEADQADVTAAVVGGSRARVAATVAEVDERVAAIKRLEQVQKDALRRAFDEQVAAAQDALRQRQEALAAEAEQEEAALWAMLEKRKQLEMDATAARLEAQRAELQARADAEAEYEANQQAMLARRDSAVRDGAQTLMAAIQAMEQADRKKRVDALKKYLGQELMHRGAVMLIEGVADLAAMNYAKGAGELAGGAAMLAAGAALGASGGKKSASVPAVAQQQNGPQQIVNNNTTTLNFGVGIPQRATERAARASGGAPGSGMVGV